jgi:hypothetical protein
VGCQGRGEPVVNFDFQNGPDSFVGEFSADVRGRWFSCKDDWFAASAGFRGRPPQSADFHPVSYMTATSPMRVGAMGGRSRSMPPPGRRLLASATWVIAGA